MQIGKAIGSFFKGLFGSKAGQSVKAFAMTEVQKAVAAIKTTAIGATVAADIRSLTTSRLTTQERFEQVVANTLPLVAQLATAPGAAQVAIEDVNSVTRELVQSIFNDTKSTKAGSIAATILTLLGLR